jgi:hypothetical protein
MVDAEMASKRSITLLVIQPDEPARLCSYGSQDPSSWNGVICDDDNITKACPMFQPLVDSEQARVEAETLLADDEWVLTNMKDVAALQWVLGDRVYKKGLNWFQRLKLWIQVKMTRVPKPIFLPELPANIWDDDPVGSHHDPAEHP